MTGAIRHRVTAALAILLVAAAGCGDDESERERAQNRVCDARADIQKQLGELGDARLETITRDTIEQRLNAIKNDLDTIVDARGELSSETAAQIDEANRAFRTELESAAEDLRRTRSLNAALTDLQNALVGLGDAYEQALAPIDCG